MLCENIFCIYHSNGKCTLERIELDVQGNCKCCIYVDIPEAELQKRRKSFFDK